MQGVGLVKDQDLNFLQQRRPRGHNMHLLRRQKRSDAASDPHNGNQPQHEASATQDHHRHVQGAQEAGAAAEDATPDSVLQSAQRAVLQADEATRSWVLQQGSVAPGSPNSGMPASLLDGEALSLPRCMEMRNK